MTPQRWVDLESGKASLDDDDGDSVVAYQQSNNETIPTARSPAKTYFEDYPAATIAAPSESPESTLLVRPSLVQQSRLRDIEYSTQHRPKEMKRKTVIFCKRKKFLFLDTTQRSRAHPSFSKSPSQLRDEHVYNAINPNPSAEKFYTDRSSVGRDVYEALYALLLLIVVAGGVIWIIVQNEKKKT